MTTKFRSGPLPPSHGLLGWEGPGKPVIHRLTPPLWPTRVCKYLFFYHVRIFFSSLLAMQKWSSKHIESTPGEKAPPWGEAGPKKPQHRAKGGPLPFPALPTASTAPRETPALSPFPPAIIQGPQPHPGAAASSCASIYYSTM